MLILIILLYIFGHKWHGVQIQLFQIFLCFSQEFTDSGLGNGLGLISLNDASRNLRGFVIEARSLIPQNTLPVAATDYSNRNENDRNYRLVPDKKYDP